MRFRIMLQLIREKQLSLNRLALVATPLTNHRATASSSFRDLLSTPSRLYVTRLPSGALKLRGFSSSRIRLSSTHPRSYVETEREPKKIHLLRNGFSPSPPPSPSHPLILPMPLFLCLPHASLHSIANAIQFRRWEGEGWNRPANGVRNSAWRSADASVESSPVTRGKSQQSIPYISPPSAITHEYLESFFTRAATAPHASEPVSLYAGSLEFPASNRITLCI